MKRFFIYAIPVILIVGFIFWLRLSPSEKENIRDLGKMIKNDPITITDEEVILKEDYHYAKSFYLNERSIVHIKFEKLEGPDFETFFTDYENYEKFKDGKEFELFPGLSFENLKGVNKNETFGPGNFVFILDNSDKGAVLPPMNFRDDVLRVRLFISKQREE